MPKKRKADELVGEGSFLDKLKRRRKLMEKGYDEEASRVFKEDKLTKKKKEKKY